jgi:hypothetical protein
MISINKKWLLMKEQRMLTGSALVLGYLPAQIQGKKIEDLIPGFYDEFDFPSCDR